MTAIIEDAKEIVVNKWGTLNTVASPQKLPEGHSPNNQNVWMDEKPGSVITAQGYIKLGTIPSNLPPTGLINFFKTSDGSSRLVVTDNESVWHTTNYVDFTLITSGLAASFQLRGAIIRDKLWLTNGSDPVMTWDGTTLTELDGTGATPDVPLSKYIEYHDERVWLYGIQDDLSSLRFTALANSSGTEIAPDSADAWPADNEIQISEGDADVGTGIFLYRGYLYCSKQFSIWRITGYDEYTYTRTKTRASTGTRFQESIRIVDNLVHFIGVDGLYTFDGESATRISDIIDPSSSDEGVFAFRNLQQPLLNNQFWTVTETADFSAGSVPANLSTASNRLTLLPADDTQADFSAGTLTDITATETPGLITLDYDETAASTTNVALGQTPFMSTSIMPVIGQSSYINNGSNANYVGARINTGFSLLASMAWEVTFSSELPVSTIVVKNLYYEGKYTLNIVTSKIQYWNGSAWNDVPGGSVVFPTPVLATFTPVLGGSGTGTNYRINNVDITVNFGLLRCRGLRYFLEFRPSTSNPGTGSIGQPALVATEVEIYKSAYESSGKFVSKTLDLLDTPTSLGTIAASQDTTGGTIQLFTQSSVDGSTWEPEVNLANGAAIGSTPARYVRWGAYFTSTNGNASPQIGAVYLGTQYISVIHDTGGGLFAWSAFQMAYNALGQTVQAYFRAAATSPAVSGEAWTAILPGAVPSADATDVFIQFRVEMSTADATLVPYVESFAFNWILAIGGINTLQNVASFVWLNRYWMAAATLGAEENDIVIVRGKSTFGYPWHKKDFKFLSFARFQDSFIAGSSEDGSIYRLEYGYSKNGEAMDSFFETQDFSNDGFILKGKEMLVTADLTGPYPLSIGYSTDGGINYTDRTMDLTRESGVSLSDTRKFNINFMAESVRFRVRINAADQPFSVDEIRVFYRPSPQRGAIH